MMNRMNARKNSSRVSLPVFAFILSILSILSKESGFFTLGARRIFTGLKSLAQYILNSASNLCYNDEIDFRSKTRRIDHTI